MTTGPNSWLNALQTALKAGNACVVITVFQVDGSAPRPVGTRMLVTDAQVVDTIGGGSLEHTAIKHARDILTANKSMAAITTVEYPLAKTLSQCCGGRVVLQFDYHPANRFQIIVFGAGHVASALATILRAVPCQAHFYDSRKEWLEQLPAAHNPESNIKAHELGNNPFEAVDACPAGAFYVVMTHSHETDFDLVEAVLTRGDAAYCGLIASRAKANRFRMRLQRKQFDQHEIAGLTAPIGVSVETGNSPMEVAVAATADLLTRRTRLLRDKHQTLPTAFPRAPVTPIGPR